MKTRNSEPAQDAEPAPVMQLALFGPAWILRPGDDSEGRAEPEPAETGG